MLNEKIKEFRTKKGLSQEELANRLCVVRQTVSKWEKGISVPDAEKLVEVSKVLEVSVNALLEIDDSQNSDEILKELAALRNKRRKAIRTVCVIVLIFAILIILGTFIFGYMSNHLAVNEDVSVIGGADGPTAIFVSSPINPMSVYLTGIALSVISLIGIFKTKKN